MVVDIIVVALFLVFGALGYTRGFVRSALAMVKISVSVIIAVLLARPLANLLENWFGASRAFGANGGLIMIAICAVAIFIVIRLLLRLIKALSDKTKERSRVINFADRWLGLLFGFLRFCFMFVIISAVVYLISAIPFLSGLRDGLFQDSKVALWLYNLATDVVFAKILAAVGI
jgi:uncharacterized membrane protein required for colicin V production